MKNKPTPIYRKDYQVFDYVIDSLQLKFQLYEGKTIVSAVCDYSKNPLSKKTNPPLVLSGEKLQLIELELNDKVLEENCYTVSKDTLTVNNLDERFSLKIVTEINPEKNSSLEGLYLSSGNYCTQCEAEGFRKITYYPDRPDVLTTFTTRIEADKSLFPVLLSNGNLVEKGELESNRHYVVWHDPFPKPSYLFALVAGNLVAIDDEFVTRSGKIVELKIYVEEQNINRCSHAMSSLKKSMRWDEDTFDLEYDLDIFMIVAVDDFNMGAMENKGLNIFNSKYVLTSPESATDLDYLGVEGVIAHEYFHNWTGNRVTCRDWFQLSLKEGLTVFRDQEFSSDMNSRPVQRIDDVRLLKNFQFKEDASPMAHPIRPDSYVEINNFYTATVYNKGAEVIRMMHTILGVDNFKKGMDLYFQRHDGQAVTCDDFVTAMSDASEIDLEQFRNWYRQAGTPNLQISSMWHEEKREYQVVISQSCPDTPEQTNKRPFHMPIKVGIIDDDGNSLISSPNPEDSIVLDLKEKEQIFVFKDIEKRPILSVLRDFSAPVRFNRFHSRSELAIIATKDQNLYNRWGSATALATEIILELSAMVSQNQPLEIDTIYLDAVARSLENPAEDAALLALTLQLPSDVTLGQEVDQIDPDALFYSRQYVKKVVAHENKDTLLDLYNDNQETDDYSIEPSDMARRSLKNMCLAYLMSLDPLPDEMLEICEKQYYSSGNMTDTIGAMRNLVNISGARRDLVLKDFYAKWKDNTLVLDKWFALQAMSWLPDTLERVVGLMDDKAFSISNPNKVRSLVGSFCSGNHFRFHNSSGDGYRFLTNRILELDSINPQIAARLVTPFVSWKKYEPQRASLMQDQLREILAKKALSSDVYEIVSKSLKDE